MLDYEWGNPTAAVADPPPESNVVVDRHINFDHYSFHNDSNNFLSHSHSHHPHQLMPPQQIHNLNSLFDPRSFGGASYSYPPPPPSMLSLEPTLPLPGPGGFLVVPKSEDASRSMEHFTASSRIGLNLGGRTYFSSSEDDFVNRLYRRSKPGVEAGSANSPRCQAEGCAADLTHAKHYHRRHKVCEFHSKASTVIAAGLTQRFCQQCSRFHVLSEFDNGKRSCRKRLADHNRRRRKSQQSSNENQKSQGAENVANSPADSGAQSSSSVTVAISPPRMSLECFPHRQYCSSGSGSGAAPSSLFFSTG